MTESIIDFIGDYIMPWFLILLIGFVIVLIPYAIYSCYQESQKEGFELKKVDWGCTNYHEYVTTVYTMSGKVMIPITTFHKDCIQWTHK